MLVAIVQGILLGVATATILEPIEVDGTRLQAERAADADVLSSLHHNGDCASAVRSVELRFVGSKLGVLGLSAKSADLGFTFIQSVQMPDGENSYRFIDTVGCPALLN